MAHFGANFQETKEGVYLDGIFQEDVPAIFKRFVKILTFEKVLDSPGMKQTELMRKARSAYKTDRISEIEKQKADGKSKSNPWIARLFSSKRGSYWLKPGVRWVK
jgi:hypothetical protein